MGQADGTTKKRGCVGRMVRVGMGLGVLGAGASVVGGIVLGYLYYQNVIVDPGPHIEASHVRSIISQESPVYYRDGITRIGVFFEDEHRQYVSYERLPLAWQMGIVAAEDGAYWSHGGVNLKHLVRAMRDNILAGTVVAGGSTLTQQTAKNLYYRPDRSLKSKGTELVNALRLEAHFEKQQILTFYANQFHVSGNGRGLGIGARYFFDKEVEELSVHEAAFLCGLVKGPSNYDPFLGDEARRTRARERAHDRTTYVLRRMTEEGIEDLVPPMRTTESQADVDARTLEAGRIRAEAKRLLDDGFELQFKRGTFRYDSNAVLDEVARRLAEPPFDEVLAKAGIEDPATAGLKVVTTLDPAAQRGAIYGLWHHLTEIGTWMEKLGPDDFKVKGSVRYDPDRALEPHTFRNAKVASIEPGPGKHLVVDVGGQPCTVDRDAIVRAAVAVKRGADGNKSSKAKTAEVDRFVGAFAVDDRLLVSVRELKGTTTHCDLEVRPELQGAVIVLEDGEVRAMVGGNDNRNFNRTTALRQMGSTWKPLVFHAALELGWKPSDLLDNRRNVFPFSTTFYYPRPDHNPQPEISMSWAGVNSENLASVWLLYHLTDRLDRKQLSALADTLGLSKQPGEDDKAYAKRIQELGVLPTPNRRAEAEFARAKADLLASGLTHATDALALQSMYYGWGFDAEVGRVKRAGGRVQATKLAALNNRWTHLSERLASCRAQHLLFERAWKRGGVPSPSVTSDLSVMMGEDGIQVACGAVPEGYGPIDATLGEKPPTSSDVVPPVPGPAPVAPAPAPEPRRFKFPWQKDDSGAKRDPLSVLGLKRAQPDLQPFSSTLIEGRYHAGTLIELDASLRRDALTAQLGGAERAGLYDPEVLYYHQDFRVLMGLKYLETMARTYGVSSEIKTVMSLPLGANEITLEEIASVYSGITTGEVRTFPGTGVAAFAPPPTATLLIAEIRDVDDNVLYRAEPLVRRVAPVEAGEMTADILRNVVLHGTGRRAKTAVAEQNTSIPLGGKTGTTNDFKNAVFAGFAPKAVDGRYSVAEGFVVAAYVGYDDNRPMKNGRIRLAGASGALPAWIDTVEGLQVGGLLGSVPSGASSSGGFWPLHTTGSLVRVPADDIGSMVAGGAWTPGTPGMLVPLPTVREAPVVRFEVAGRPIRIAPRTDSGNRPPSIRDLWGRSHRRRRRPSR